MRNYTPPDKSILLMWIVYDRPADFPDQYVARLWEVGRGVMMPRDTILTCKSLDLLRSEMRARGLTVVPRFDNDDPKIVEAWL